MLDNELVSVFTELSRDVPVLRWPSQRAERDALAKRRLPRFLLVEGDEDPPPYDGTCLEDWQRMPAKAEDVLARITVLAERSGVYGRPVLDSLGQLSHGRKRVVLSPTEEKLVGCLLERFATVVGDEVLIARGWPDGDATEGALRIHLTRLRRRLRPLGLEIRSRRGVGHALQEIKPGRRAQTA